jgi:hypothetical protein
MERDFLYALLLVGSLTAFYFVVVFVLFIAGQVSFVALVLTIIGTIAANSLFDAARIALDRFFYQSQFQKLRGNLRALAREVGSGGTLAERLHAVLASLCHLFRIRQGFIALNENNQWIVRATHQANPIGQSFDASALAATESIGLLHSEKKGLARMLLLIPLFAGSRQIGALVLGAQESQQPYTENDLALLEDLGDQIAALIHAAQAQAENARVIDALVQDFRERERALQLQMQEMLAAPERAPTAPDINVENLVPQVEDALRHLSDFAYLGEHPLAQLRVVEQRLRARSESALTFIERGKVVNEIIVQTLDSLRPAGVAPKKEQTPSREWHPFIILHDSYVEDEPNRDIMLRLALGEGTFNRARRRALYGLAKSLAEIEQKTRAP